MFDLFCLRSGTVLRFFRTRRSLMLENLALRQQLAVLQRRHPRPRLSPVDKLFWVLARRFCLSDSQRLDPKSRGSSCSPFTVLDHCGASTKRSCASISTILREYISGKYWP